MNRRLALRAAVASAEADELLTYAYAKAAEQVLASAGLEAARDLLAAASRGEAPPPPASDANLLQVRALEADPITAPGAED